MNSYAQFHFAVNLDKDRDLAEFLAAKRNISKYLRDLIYADMERSLKNESSRPVRDVDLAAGKTIDR